MKWTSCALVFGFALAEQGSLRDGPAHWCSEGLHSPTFQEDYGRPSIDIIVAQAPLFSNNRIIGKKLGYFGIDHTALVFLQTIGETTKHFTLEFDAVENVVNATVPQIDEEDHLIWRNAARYCLTEGILWGRGHWSTGFKVAMQMTSAQVQELFGNFVRALNSSAPDRPPLYQLWRVVHRERRHEVMVGDITCGNGVNWALNYANSTMGLSFTPGFKLASTIVTVPATAVMPVNVSDPAEWSSVVHFFRSLGGLADKKQNFFQKLMDVLQVLPLHYVYDGNAHIYYRVIGNKFPYFQAHLEVMQLAPPPWDIEPTELEVQV